MSNRIEIAGQLRKVLKSKSKRQRKKQWGKCVDMCGLDGEGLINYAKIAIVIRDYLTEEEISRLRRIP